MTDGLSYVLHCALDDIERLTQERDEAHEENKKLRKVLQEGSDWWTTRDGEQSKMTFAETLRYIAETCCKEWEDWLVCKADDIDEALGDKG